MKNCKKHSSDNDDDDNGGNSNDDVDVDSGDIEEQ